jgi:ATP-binding cassette subfamily B multidrug efflux pump
MDRGQVIEDGTHDELLRNGGIYAQLWNRQSGGFIMKDGGGNGADAVTV